MEPSEFPSLVPTGPATALLPVDGGRTPPVTVIGNEAIRATFDRQTLQQAINARRGPGVDAVVLNPDAHVGYGAPIGCVMASGSHIYPGPVGVDIKCSMSLLQLDLPIDQLISRQTRRAVIDAICERVPTGAGRGQRSVRKSRHVSTPNGRRALVEGASAGVLESLGIPAAWAERCEDSHHLGHDDTHAALEDRLDRVLLPRMGQRFEGKIGQLGSYGGGNHFGECERVTIEPGERAARCAEAFGLREGCAAFLSHCGSRGMGHDLATGQFAALQRKFEQWGTPLPAGDAHLVYAPLDTPEADAYLDDMALGANFATVNHMLINALVLEAFQQVFPGVRGELVYFISHNIARRELVNGRMRWIMRKGATRAFPAGHPALMGTRYEAVGHPILLPGDPQRGSAVLVADEGAERSLFSVNHGAGRVMGRKNAIRTLDQAAIDRSFDERDILTNCRNYPRDEAPAAYKDFNEVIASVTEARLAGSVARLDARFVIKDSSDADD